ncbi:hypothetical protein HU200_047962 [Digitaria exilis]|uniref:Rx N-terminal domain-containing protein n=1 Tax=Digitaria exilis TaxID=1010633 RepID=A0A835E9S4_9POAL|nr:hypothetical protein HU200_047962 [Digitaria exilis]
MEAAISAVATEIFSRVISFLIQRYRDKTEINEKLERMQQLLLRIHAVVEEAEGRYITNPIMLRLSCREHVPRVSHSGYLQRSRSISHTRRSCAKINDLRSVLENLEAAIASVNEFVVLLGGCDRCFRRPYDMYLYTDNIMFGRHVEKQQVINILLQDPEEHGTPTVLPIIGGCRVGKKTLVNYVCQNERIKSYFSSIMFLNGYNISRMDTGKLQNGRVLAVIEFVTDVNDDDWVKFYSTVKHTACDGSKVIIISRIQNLVRFGTVQTLHLNSLTHQEYKYLFRMLAFGSIDEKDYPQLVAVASELAIVLGGSLITANIIADLLRRNLDVKFWFRILQRFKAMVDNNLSMYGEHPKDILEN